MISIPSLSGQFMFNPFFIMTPTILKPIISEFDIKECELFSDLKQVIEEAYTGIIWIVR